jgi:biopolymer transport protein ExbD
MPSRKLTATRTLWNNHRSLRRMHTNHGAVSGLARAWRSRWEGRAMRFHRRSPASGANGIQMSSMIDIVFLLLVFFVMTFKIVALEGEFRMKAPVGQGLAGAVVEVPPVWVRLASGEDGQLAAVRVNSVDVGNIEGLREEVSRMTDELRASGSGTEELEAVLDCDYDLDYDHVVQAIDAIRGYKDHSGNVVDLIPNVRFAPIRGS